MRRRESIRTYLAKRPLEKNNSNPANVSFGKTITGTLLSREKNIYFRCCISKFSPVINDKNLIPFEYKDVVKPLGA